MVVFATGAVTPLEKVYAADNSSPTLEEINTELIELENMLVYFTGWTPQNVYAQDAKVFTMVKSYSGTHLGDMSAYKAYIDEYLVCLNAAKDTLAWHERDLANASTNAEESIAVAHIRTDKTVLANIAYMQTNAQTAVFSQFATVTCDIPNGKATASMDGHSIPVTVDGQIKSGYYFTLTATITVEDLGTVTYTLNHDGWSKQANGTWRYYQYGYYLFDGRDRSNYGFFYANRGWEKINSKWYYFDDNGVMKTGWLKDYRWHYLGGKDDGAMKTGWQKVSGKWYYLSATDVLPNSVPYAGKMQTGWQKISNQWYYLGSADSGVMVTGWKQVSGKWYYFGGAGDGKMKTGWQTINGKRYYFGSSGDGAMKTGTVKISGKTYRFAASGALVG
jgi:hypothetical protein